MAFNLKLVHGCTKACQSTYDNTKGFRSQTIASIFLRALLRMREDFLPTILIKLSIELCTLFFSIGSSPSFQIGVLSANSKTVFFLYIAL